MTWKWNGWALMLLLTLGGSIRVIAADGSSRYVRAVQRAVALLPRPPAQVSVIDVNDARPEDRDVPLEAPGVHSSRTSSHLRDRARRGVAGSAEGLEFP